MELLEDLHDLALELKVGVRNPAWLIMRLRNRFECLRPTFPLHKHSLPEVRRLRSQGVLTDFNLTQEQRQQIWKYAVNTPCYGNSKLGNALRYRDEHQFETGHYFNTQRDCATVDQLSRDEKILAIAEDFLGGKPLLLGTNLWWSFAGKGVDLDSPSRRRWGQLFHYDLDGAVTLKFFFYLTDVDLESGPHAVIEGSARGKPFVAQIRRRGWTRAVLENYYPRNHFLTLTGAAGFGFIEDPFCFHRGCPPLSKNRLLLCLNYGSVDYYQQHDRQGWYPGLKLAEAMAR